MTRMTDWSQRQIVGDVNLRWPAMNDANREQEYSPSSVVGSDFQRLISAYGVRSEQARAQCDHLTVCRYGPEAANTIEIAIPGDVDREGPCPLLVYIHGGYWQELSRSDSFFAADGFVARGIAFAAVGYTLAPTAGIPQIVDECRTAMRWLRAAADEFPYDGDFIFVAGSSAGAHLAAMTAMPGNSESHYSPAGAGLVSGIFDIEPLVGTSINAALKLSNTVARDHSPMLQNVNGFPPALLAWGEIETDEFKRQSRAFAKKLLEKNVPARTLEVAAKNHFDVVMDLADTSTPLGSATTTLINAVRKHRADVV